MLCKYKANKLFYLKTLALPFRKDLKPLSGAYVSLRRHIMDSSIAGLIVFVIMMFLFASQIKWEK